MVFYKAIGPTYAIPATPRCPECYKALTEDDAYGHDCEV
jgi:hypothetical protein